MCNERLRPSQDNFGHLDALVQTERSALIQLWPGLMNGPSRIRRELQHYRDSDEYVCSSLWATAKTTRFGTCAKPPTWPIGVLYNLKHAIYHQNPFRNAVMPDKMCSNITADKLYEHNELIPSEQIPHVVYWHTLR